MCNTDITCTCLCLVNQYSCPVDVSSQEYLVTVSILLLVSYIFNNLPWYRLPNPGICFPFLGHIHNFFTKRMLADPINGLCDMFRKHQRKGVMWTRSFNMDILWVGDFITLHFKFNFNHPQMQDRFSPRFHGSNEMERKLEAGQDIPGVQGRPDLS